MTDVAGSTSLPGWSSERYAEWMRVALDQAALTQSAPDSRADVPVGAVVVDGTGDVIGVGHNVRETRSDPTGHAEILAVRRAGAALGSWRLEGCSLVVTLEPCAMCAGAASLARVDRIVFGAFDPKAGACGSAWDLPRDRRTLHRSEIVAGVLEAQCQAMLSEFFATRRLR